jgi:hypothetical protein
MAQQTAVEWLFEKITEQGTNPYWDMRFIQAKQMEKEQIIDSYIMGSYDMAAKEFNPEKYYNETYNK